jgi:7-cyano-7-deazaguanine reductase
MNWSDSSLLVSIKNTCPGHTHILETEELSFYGFPTQADYAKISIEVKPDEKAIELKSVKEYLRQFREKHISYERILNCVFEDFWNVYYPLYLKITMETQPRGGISSTLFISKEKNTMIFVKDGLKFK